MTEGDIEFLDRRLVNELGIRPCKTDGLPTRGRFGQKATLRLKQPNKSVELEKTIYDGEKLLVAQLQLEDVKAADAVVFEKLSALQTRFVRLLIIRALIEGQHVGQVMIDGRAMVNVMPISFLKKLGKSEDELKPTNTTMTDFTGNGQQARGVLTTELTVESKTLWAAFFVVDADSHYNLVLSCDWVHANECMPSTLHGKLFQWVEDCVEKIRAEGRPQMVGINAEDVGHINWADTDPDQIRACGSLKIEYNCS
uniref:Uncharacterized protein n=1 Tax=Ananas comosus var. bracteatus TaxID=296719 RepID=A0A6V7QUK6_ANACO